MTEELAYQINIDVYKGPFDLLLQGIEAGEVDIFNVSLSQITTSYFEYWRREIPDLVVASDFLYMAAYLIELKSKSLLPARDEIVIEEEEEFLNLEESLLSHIQEYQVYKDMAVTLRQRKEVFEKVYGRHEGEKEEREFELVDVSLKDLVLAFKKVYDEAAKREKVVAIRAEEITLEDRIIEIKRIVAGRKDGVPFADIFLRKTRLEIIVSFLAVLELAKQRFIQIAQGRRFGTVIIFAVGVFKHGIGTKQT